MWKLCRLAIFCLTPVFDQVLHVNENLVFPSCLSQQEKMELMIINTGDTQQFFEESGECQQVCQWKGVDCNMINKVTGIVWNHHNVNLGGGYIELSHIPLTVAYYNIQNQKLKGSLILRALPKHIRELYLTSNYIRGEIILADLPGHIKDVYLGDNYLTGSLDFSDLPQSVEYLILRRNNISQEEVVVEQSITSKNLVRVDLSENQIDRVVNGSKLRIHDHCIDIHSSGNL